MAANVRALPSDAVHQVCSAQVIADLPACLKELVENALDAGASAISVRLTSLGAEESRVEVSDDGAGIAQADWALVCRSHSTSKIAQFSDINSAALRTFGFRGQALSALCGLSRGVSIHTRTAEMGHGVHLDYDAQGSLLPRESLLVGPRVTGTTVAVRGLFQSIPVRHREFVGTLKRQVAASLALLQGFAVQSPSTRFDLVMDARSLFAAPGGPPGRSALTAMCLLHGMAEGDMVPLQAQGQRFMWSLDGWISAPSRQAQGRRGAGGVQYTIVNGRVTQDLRGVSRTLNATFPEGRPCALLRFTLDPTDVDVNVSPDKRLVLLAASVEKEIQAEVEKALRAVWGLDTARLPIAQPQPRVERVAAVAAAIEPKAFVMRRSPSTSASSATPPARDMRAKRFEAEPLGIETVRDKSVTMTITPLLPASPQAKRPRSGATLDGAHVESERGDKAVRRVASVAQEAEAPISESAAVRAEAPVAAPVSVAVVPEAETKGPLQPESHSPDLPTSVTFAKHNFAQMDIVGQFNHGFIIARLPEGSGQHLFLIDQHAADEKFLFEKYTDAIKVEPQPLVAPLPVRLSPAQEETVQANTHIFHANGFRLHYLNERPPGSRVELCALPTVQGIGVGRSAPLTLEDFHELIDVVSQESSGLGSQCKHNVNGTIRSPKINAMLASRACRTATMVGDPLRLVRMKAIVTNLAELRHPWNCPHGRPTLRHLIHLDSMPPQLGRYDLSSI